MSIGADARQHAPGLNGVAGIASYARSKFVEAEPTAPEVTRTILRLVKGLFDLEVRLKDLAPEERLRRWQAEAVPLLESRHTRCCWSRRPSCCPSTRCPISGRHGPPPPLHHS